MSESKSLKNVALCRVPQRILNRLRAVYNQPIVQPGLAPDMKEYFNKTIPRQNFTIPDFTTYAASLSFHVSSQVKNADPAHNNLFFHGWLYGEVVKVTRPAGGAHSYPLVGMFDPININVSADQDPAWIGINTLVVADQHFHDYNPDFGFGEIGTDMARFRIPNPAALSSAWCVCVDPTSRRCCIMYLLIVPGDMEDQMGRALESTPTRWVSNLRDFVQRRDPRIASQITEIINVYDSS
jgi:hypothetical protein